jgi:hypothetical protein
LRSRFISSAPKARHVEVHGVGLEVGEHVSEELLIPVAGDLVEGQV